MIIGITGGTGCGKTTLLEVIRENGGLTLDCDAIYHHLLASDPALLCKIESRFPGSVQNGILQRKALGTLVFSDPDALADLNAITHRAVVEVVRRELMSSPDLAAIDAIGLFESGLDRLCDITVAVTAPRQKRIARLVLRDDVTEEYAERRIDAQPASEAFREKCDYCLENDGSQWEFRCKCLAFLRDLAIIK